MKNKPVGLIVLSVAAAVATLTGLIWTGQSLAHLGSTTELYRKKLSDIRELTSLQQTMQGYRLVLAAREQRTGSPAALPDLLRTTLPGREAAFREIDPLPTLPGWTARRMSVALTDISGDDLGRLLDEAARRQPPWSLLECTLLASPTPGRLAKVEWVLGMVEKSAENRN
jgi:hypothetical protein